MALKPDNTPPAPPAASKIDELLPCPFCGSSDLIVSGGMLGAFVHCNGCDADGPFVETSPFIAWNTRHTKAVTS